MEGAAGPAVRFSERLDIGNGIAVIEKVGEGTTAVRVGLGPWIGAWMRVGRNLVRVHRLELNRDHVGRAGRVRVVAEFDQAGAPC